MATDIAFAVAVMTSLGRRVPFGIKVFLTALAIVDDLGAILVIAIYYSGGLSITYLAIGAVILGLLALANWLRVGHPVLYILLGVMLWIVVAKSGVHATIAGVFLAMTIPARTGEGVGRFHSGWRYLRRKFTGKESPLDPQRLKHSDRPALMVRKREEPAGESTLERLEQGLHPWVSFLIVPLFAFANAGVTISDHIALGAIDAVAIGVILGLVVGKQLGITLFAWIAVRLGLAALPAKATWRHVYGSAWLGGIGFTMSLFIATLAFRDASMTDVAKVGILAGSVIACLGGVLILRGRRSAA